MTKFKNDFDRTSILSNDLLQRYGISPNSAIHAANDRREHVWVNVIDPINQRSILQACDDCGVVKSENSVIRNCRADYGTALISSLIMTKTQLAG